MNLNEMWRNLVERPRLVKLLVIFYGSHAFLFVLIFIFLGALMQGGSGQPGYTPAGAAILIFLIYIVSLVGALLNLSVACGLLLAKGWARILGIAISVLGLLFLVQGQLSLGVALVTGFYLTYLMDLSDLILSIVAIYYLTRPEVKAYFKKKRVSEREEELSKKEYEKLTKEEKHMKKEYEQLMEED